MVLVMLHVQVDTIIEEEIKSGVPSERIMIGGFSQGGALSLYTAMNSKHRLGGVVALSCWLPLHKQMGQAMQTNKDIPFLQVLHHDLLHDQHVLLIPQAHGDCDPVVPYKWGQQTSQLLKTVLPKHNFKTYKVGGQVFNQGNVEKFLCQGMMHSSCEEEMEDAKKFIADCLP